jgi:hypothetical protein
MRLAMKMRPKADQAQKASSQLLQKLPIHLRELVACVCVSARVCAYTLAMPQSLVCLAPKVAAYLGTGILVNEP